MIRIAVLADIHGNRLALDAVLDDLARQGVDRIVNLGDCVSGPLWPCETMARLAPLDAVTARGNHDRAVAETDPAMLGPSDRYAYDALTSDDRAWLGALPLTAEPAPGVLAFHATPAYDETYLLEEIDGGRLVEAEPAAIARRLGETGSARVALCGHSHRVGLVRLPSGLVVLNPGSVGCPAYRDPSDPPHVSESGAPHARYAILDVPDDGAPSVALLAVPYDWEAAARRAEANARPDWARALRTGFVRP